MKILYYTSPAISVIEIRKRNFYSCFLISLSLCLLEMRINFRIWNCNSPESIHYSNYKYLLRFIRRNGNDWHEKKKKNIYCPIPIYEIDFCGMTQLYFHTRDIKCAGTLSEIGIRI